eukprot:CAMPEP_0170645020 /NCGR_PEP_ID=MMETSP0224-20130122/42826_1 /TAXON_ID=285029 /ORGANISM="Togula jolla, Strain CCCM 725" /LENGTH=69 /DNA_ID=CAMNT_0010976147 /DNA_START=54 /DNA_END=263 /DNA_ORIENTATION=-
MTTQENQDLIWIQAQSQMLTLHNPKEMEVKARDYSYWCWDLLLLTASQLEARLSLNQNGQAARTLCKTV